MLTKRCSECESPFECGVSQNARACWCNDFPPFMPAEFHQDCRCPSCLGVAFARRVSEKLNSSSIDSMLTLASQYTDKGALKEYIDYTIEDGRYVFTQWYLIKRGYCCGNGCRNCPY